MCIDTPLVSILVPAYNHEQYVQQTIKSIIEQTYNNIELIILDDGSKDNTWQKICEMREVCEKRFVRVHFETKENEGTCTTLNKLLDLVQGKYIGMIASDDMYKPQTIEKEVEFLENNTDYALCVGNNEIIDSKGKTCYWDYNQKILYNKFLALYKTFGDYLSLTNFFDLSSEKFGSYKMLYANNHIPNGYLIRKDIFDKIGKFTVDAPLEDWYMMMQIAKYSKMKYLPEILFSYRWHNSNTVKNTKHMIDMVKRTKLFEYETLKKNNFEVFKQDVKYSKNGDYVIYNKIGINNILECIFYYNIDKPLEKNKIIKLFNIPIFKFKRYLA